MKVAGRKEELLIKGETVNGATAHAAEITSRGRWLHSVNYTQELGKQLGAERRRTINQLAAPKAKHTQISPCRSRQDVVGAQAAAERA